MFRTILASGRGWVHTIQFFFQGEPLLNPDLPRMIREAHQQHIYTIVSTNAQVITLSLAQQLVQSGLDRIIVSMDGLSEESYAAYRQGGSVEKVLSGLAALKQAKTQANSRMRIELQCLRLKSNEQEWNLFRNRYKELGADQLTFKTAQFYHYQQGNPLMPSDERYSRYTKQKDGSYFPKNRLKYKESVPLHKPCKRLLTGCVITVQGEVLPCCFDKSHQHIMGYIGEASLKTIWKSHAFSLFRHQVRMNRMGVPMCTNCTED